LAIKGVLFDFDGTLGNTTNLILITFHKTIKHFLNRDISDEEILRTFGLPLRDCLANVAPEINPDEMVAYYRDYNYAHHDSLIRPFPSVKEGLEAMKMADIPAAVVTSKTNEMAGRGLECLQIRQYIKGIIGCYDCQKHKPDPEPMARGAELLKLPAEECLCVGDSPFDLLSGKAAGCTTVLVDWSSYDRKRFYDLIKPDYTIKELKDLLPIITENN
jgi:pyrophosphatase PpaX